MIDHDKDINVNKYIAEYIRRQDLMIAEAEVARVLGEAIIEAIKENAQLVECIIAILDSAVGLTEEEKQ